MPNHEQPPAIPPTSNKLAAPAINPARLEHGLWLLAALLLGCGLVFWVAANWQEQTRQMRLALLCLALTLPVACAIAVPRLRLAGLLLGNMALGGLLAFVGQTYQTGADAWQLFAVWAALSLLWAVVARRDVVWALWLLVAALGIAMWSGQSLLHPLLRLVAMRHTQHYVASLLWLLVLLWPFALQRWGRLQPHGSAKVSMRLAFFLAQNAWCAYALVGLFGSYSNSFYGVYLFNSALLLASSLWLWWHYTLPRTSTYSSPYPRDIAQLALAAFNLCLVFLGWMIKMMYLSTYRIGDFSITTFLFVLIAAASLGGCTTWLHRLQQKSFTKPPAPQHTPEPPATPPPIPPSARRIPTPTPARNSLVAPHSADTMHWALVALSFLGAQLVALPFLLLLLVFSLALIGLNPLDPPASLIIAGLLLGTAVIWLRAKPGMFIAQLCLSAIFSSLWLFSTGTQWLGLNNTLLLGAALALAVALLVDDDWIQPLMGLAATGMVLALQWPLWHVHIPGDDDVLRYFHFAHRMAAGNAACLSLLWAWWQLKGQHTIQRRLPQSALPGRLAGIFSGVAVGLLLMPAVKLAMQHGALGSADAPWAGTAALFNFALPTLLQWAAIALAALLMRKRLPLLQTHSGRYAHAQHATSQPPHSMAQSKNHLAALLALVYLLLAIAAPWLSSAGAIALIGTIACLRGQRRLLGLAGLVLLLDLSGFYYALQWPLTNKALLLAGMGGGIAIALTALRHWHNRQPAASHKTSAHAACNGKQSSAPAIAANTAPNTSAAAPATTPAIHRWSSALLLAGLLMALGSVLWDVRGKEQVMAQGQKIYIPLMPADPRSLMQGDYMALRFAIPPQLQQQLGESATGWSLQSTRLAIASINAQGIAQLQRLAQTGQAAQQTPSQNEITVPLKLLKGQWTVVTDAFFFPEGQGTPFQNARFGEFRALPDGRMLLVGMADEKLQPIAPAPPPKSRSTPSPADSASAAQAPVSAGSAVSAGGTASASSQAGKTGQAE